MKERKAIFTVEVPIKFTFQASAKADCEKLWDIAKAEAKKRLKGAKADFKLNDVKIVDKITLFTPEELKAQEDFWAQIVGVK